jgi:two-component system sensor histidine kinase FlrB
LSGTDAARAFEPFFTTKADGTGMGLAIADAVVGDLGGELRYERVNGHTRFVVTLPRAATAKARS